MRAATAMFQLPVIAETVVVLITVVTVSVVRKLLKEVFSLALLRQKPKTAVAVALPAVLVAAIVKTLTTPSTDYPFSNRSCQKQLRLFLHPLP